MDEDEDGEDGGKGKFTLGTDKNKDSRPLSKLAEQRKARAAAKAKARLLRRGGHHIKGLDEYKAGKKKNRLQGDAQRKAALKPYAYVMLNPKITKEKYKGRATESFSTVVQGNKKGVLKGSKARLKDAKHRQAVVAKKRRQGKGKQRKPGSR